MQQSAGERKHKTFSQTSTRGSFAREASRVESSESSACSRGALPIRVNVKHWSLVKNFLVSQPLTRHKKAPKNISRFDSHETMKKSQLWAR